MSSLIGRLDDVSASYAALFCDVWGVVHNGEMPFASAVAALKRARRDGLVVVMVTNSPRRSIDVERQMAAVGVDDACWDRIVTSGDVTRTLIAEGARRVFHIGAERDLSIFDGLDVELVEERDASAVVCTGLEDDERETPADYADLLARLRARDLPFICANPDINVHRGTRFVWCAGALARDYSLLGGRTAIAGKPHAPIYEAALAQASEAAGRPLRRSDVLAIGDGVLTDVKGASDFDLDVLYVSAGIHVTEYGEPEQPDRDRLAAFLARHGQSPLAVIPTLR